MWVYEGMGYANELICPAGQFRIALYEYQSSYDKRNHFMDLRKLSQFALRQELFEIVLAGYVEF